MTAPAPRTLRLLGAALLLAGGAIHVVLAFDGYGTSTIEDLFLLNDRLFSRGHHRGRGAWPGPGARWAGGRRRLLARPGPQPGG